MAYGDKVIWSEGLFLRPHHLQQHERYLEQLIDARIRGLQRHAWGITALEVDQELLSMGKFALARAAGVLPDGTAFDIPAIDASPPPLEIPETLHGETVFLALPLRRPGAADTEGTEFRDPMARYGPQEVEIRDANVGSESIARMQVAKLRLRLMLEQQDRSAFAPLGLARVNEVRADGSIALDDGYLAPALDYRALPKLFNFLSELQGMLRHRAESLAGRITDPGSKGVAEVADFMLLQAVNRLEPLVSHLARAGSLHPEVLYRELIQISGELATFTTKGRRPADLPTYRHEDLQASFAPVTAALREALSMVAEQHAISLPLQERKYGIRVAPINDRALLDQATFILAAKAEVANEVVRTQLPTQIKIGPAEGIRQMVNAQLPGIGLRPLPVAPRQIPYHSGFTYFELDRSSQWWARLQSSGGFAVHVAGNFPGLELEFWAIRE